MSITNHLKESRGKDRARALDAAHTVAKLLAPGTAQRTLRDVNHTHPECGESLAQILADSRADGCAVPQPLRLQVAAITALARYTARVLEHAA